jgi:hypothetical protein
VVEGGKKDPALGKKDASVGEHRSIIMDSGFGARIRPREIIVSPIRLGAE